MKVFFSALSRNLGTLLLSLALVAGLSYYLLSYVPQQTASLNARYFRVLSRIGYNVKEKIKAQHLNDEGDARSIAHLMSYRLVDFWKNLHPGQPVPEGYGPPEFVGAANEILADRPGPEKYHLKPAHDSSAYKYSLQLSEGQFEFGYIVPPAPAAGARRWKKVAFQPPVLPPAPKKKTIPKPPTASRRPAASLAVVAAGAAAQPAAADSTATYELTHTVPVDTLIRELRRPDVFDYFFVVELPSHRLLYCSDKTDFYLADAAAGTAGKQRLPNWLADSVVHPGRTGAFTFGGQEYQLFAQPVRLGSHLNCLLVGGVASRRFNAERRALPPGWPEQVVGLGLLCVLALPFLKLWLMSTREQIHRHDVLLSAASLVLGTGVLLLTLQASLFQSETKELVRQHLAALAEDVARDLHGELTEINKLTQQVDELAQLTDNSIMQGPHPAAPRPDGALTSLTDMNLPRSFIDSVYAVQRRSGDYDYITWITKDGQGQYGINLADSTGAAGEYPDALAKTMRYCLPSLAGRKYLKKINEQDYQQVSDDSCRLAKIETAVVGRDTVRTLAAAAQDACYFEMLRTVRNVSPLRVPEAADERNATQLKAVLARQSAWKKDMVCVFETRLVCFDDRIIPPGYGFCLIEPDGEVMAHSDPNLNLSENLLADCEPGSELQAVLNAQQQPGQTIEAMYQGKPTLLYVRPLAGMNRYLITFFDMKYAKAQQSQTSLLAFLLLLRFWLLAALLALVSWLVLGGVRQRTLRERFQAVWPHPAHAARYWQVVVGQVLGLLLLAGVATQVGPLSQLALLVVVPLPLFVLTYYHIRLRATGEWGVLRWAVALGGGGLAAVLALHWQVVGGAETAWLAGVALGMSVLVAWLLRAVPGSWLAQHAGRRSYRLAYVALLLGWIGLLGVVPALSCYRVAYVVERLQQVRAGQLRILQAYAQREEKRWSATNSLSNNFFYHSDFFFKSAFRPFEERTTAYHPGPAERAALQFFTDLRVPITRTDEEEAKALVADATPNAQWHPWQVSSLAADTVTVITQDNESRSQVTSRVDGLQLGWPRTELARRRWLFVALLALVLAALVSYLLRRLFGLSARAVASPGPAGVVAPFTAPARRFWLLPTGSAWADVPTWARRKLGRAVIVRDYQPATLRQLLAQQAAPAVIVLDCRQLFGPAPYTSQRAAVAALLSRPAASAQPPTLVLASFDFCLIDSSLTQLKLQMLNELQQRGWPLVVLSASHPDVFGDCGHPLEKPCPDKDHSPIRKAGQQLLDALSEFRMEYFALQGEEPVAMPIPATKAGEEEPLHELFGNDQALQDFFEEECQAFPFVASLRPVLLEKLWQQHAAGHTITPGAIETTVQRLAQFHFRRLWLALSPQEKFLLYDLAQDGLVNTDNGLALNILLQKGFLRRADNGRLSLRSASFRGFIRTAQRQREAMQYVASSEQGTWAATQTPLLLLLAAGATFMFITQPTTFSQTQTFLLGLTSLLPALAGFVKFLLTPKPPASSAAS